MGLTRAELSHVRRLRDKAAREAAGLFVVEGPKVVRELLAAGHAFTALYATDAWTEGPAGGIPITRVSESEMARMSHFPTPSAVLAIGQLRRATLGPRELNHGYTLALDAIQDPGNVGALLRIADWFALDRVLLSPECADLFSQKVINASMGSFARVRVISTELAPALAGAEVPVFGCDLTGERYDRVAPPPAAVILIGSEGRGLSAAVAGRITQRLTIPRFGGAESLNAAVAAGIVCAHLRRSS